MPGSRTRGSPPDAGRFDLHGVVVSYENRPDQCTVYPRDCPQDERVTRWLSADRSAFVPLEALR